MDFTFEEYKQKVFVIRSLAEADTILHAYINDTLLSADVKTF